MLGINTYFIWLHWFTVLGSFPEEEGGKYYNTCTVYDPSGTMIAKHRKVSWLKIKTSLEKGTCPEFISGGGAEFQKICIERDYLVINSVNLLYFCLFFPLVFSFFSKMALFIFIYYFFKGWRVGDGNAAAPLHPPGMLLLRDSTLNIKILIL